MGRDWRDQRMWTCTWVKSLKAYTYVPRANFKQVGTGSGHFYGLSASKGTVLLFMLICSFMVVSVVRGHTRASLKFTQPYYWLDVWTGRSSSPAGEESPAPYCPRDVAILNKMIHYGSSNFICYSTHESCTIKKPKDSDLTISFLIVLSHWLFFCWKPKYLSDPQTEQQTAVTCGYLEFLWHFSVLQHRHGTYI